MRALALILVCASTGARRFARREYVLAADQEKQCVSGIVLGGSKRAWVSRADYFFFGPVFSPPPTMGSPPHHSTELNTMMSLR